MNSSYAKYDVSYTSFDINKFRGFNSTPTRGNSEMREMLNLSSRNYPYLSPRLSRGNVDIPEGIGNIEKIFRANGKLCFIAGGRLWYDGKAVGELSSGTTKSVAVCNGKICVMPDKLYYDYLNDVFGRMNGKTNLYVDKSSYITLRFYKSLLMVTNDSVEIDFPWENYVKDGDRIKLYDYITGEYSEEYAASIGKLGNFTALGLRYLNGEAVEKLNDRDDFYLRTIIVINDIDILAFGSTVMTIGTVENGFTFDFRGHRDSGISNIDEFYRFSDFVFNFESDDVLKIGDSDTEYSVSVINKGSGSYTINFKGSAPEFERGVLTLSRVIPDMNFICERDNRLFGVCSKDNTVVASKLGNPLQYYYFSGTSLDSYSVEVGSDGEFTGIATYNGNVVLFKERHIHLLSGSKPSMFRLEGIENYGCQKGCSDSICAIGGRLFYKSLRGIYVFDGSYPVCISRALGDEKYFDAFAADDDRRYYVSMKDSKGNRCIFVYDTDTDFWHIEEGEKAVSMCELSGDIYVAGIADVMRFGDGNENVPWSAVFGPFDLYTENKKVISSVALRYKLPEGSSLCVEVSYDDGNFEVVKEIFYSYDTVLFCDIPIKRCNEFNLRLSGKGDVKIQGLSFKVRESTGGR